MKEEFTMYLKDISFPEEFIPSVTNVLDFYSKILNLEISNIIVTDYVNGEGQRVFDNLFLLNEKYIMEAKNFLFSNDFDCAPYNSIEYWDIKYFDFDLKTTNEKSRIIIDLSLTCSGQGTGCQFKGTGKNCLHIFNYFVKEIPKRVENYCASK